MIRIRRTDCPPFLKRSKAKKAYSEKPVVRALWRMQHQKCCYCETLIPEKGHSKAVEHFQPRAANKRRTNDWENLLLACAQCNGRKSDKFPVELTEEVIYRIRTSPLLLNPTDVSKDPEDHLDFVLDVNERHSGLIKARNESEFGEATIRVVGLADDLCTRRHRGFLQQLTRELWLLMEAHDRKEKAVIECAKNQFQLYVSRKGQFSGLARAFARRYNLQRYGVQIPST